jgi:hypothetical protein
MRGRNSSSRGDMDKRDDGAVPEAVVGAAQTARDEQRGGSALPGGLRLRGIISRRMKRPIKDDLELVMYVVTSENGARTVECLGKPGGHYLRLGELVDLEVDFRMYQGKDGMQHTSLRLVAYNGEF